MVQRSCFRQCSKVGVKSPVIARKWQMLTTHFYRGEADPAKGEYVFPKEPGKGSIIYHIGADIEGGVSNVCLCKPTLTLIETDHCSRVLITATSFLKTECQSS